MNTLENQTNKRFSKGKERILRKTTTFEIIDREQTLSGKAFTTRPLIRRKKTGYRLVRRIAQELVDSWYPETEVSYEAMDKRLLAQFERCDRKTRLAYLGRSATRQVEHIDQEVWYRKSGTVTYKDHTFTHRLPAKKGYLELFGLATLYTNENGKAWFRLHHTIQGTLAPEPPTQRVNVCDESKKFSLPLNRDSNHIVEHPETNVTYSEGKKRESLLTERENRSSESILSPEELRILKATPKEIPDRGRIQWEGGQ